MQNDSAPESAAMTRKHVAVFMARFRTAAHAHAEEFEGIHSGCTIRCGWNPVAGTTMYVGYCMGKRGQSPNV